MKITPVLLLFLIFYGCKDNQYREKQSNQVIGAAIQHFDSYFISSQHNNGNPNSIFHGGCHVFQYYQPYDNYKDFSQSYDTQVKFPDTTNNLKTIDSLDTRAIEALLGRKVTWVQENMNLYFKNPVNKNNFVIYCTYPTIFGNEAILYLDYISSDVYYGGFLIILHKEYEKWKLKRIHQVRIS